MVDDRARACSARHGESTTGRSAPGSQLRHQRERIWWVRTPFVRSTGATSPPWQEQPVLGPRPRPRLSERPSPASITDRARAGLEPQAVHVWVNPRQSAGRGGSTSRFPWSLSARGVHPLSLLNDLSRPSNGPNPRSCGPSCRCAAARTTPLIGVPLRCFALRWSRRPGRL